MKKTVKTVVSCIGILLLIAGCGGVGRMVSPSKTYNQNYDIRLTRSMQNPKAEFTKIANALGLGVTMMGDSGYLGDSTGNPKIGTMVYGKDARLEVTLTPKSGNVLSVQVKLVGNFGYAKKENADTVMREIKQELSKNNFL